MILVRLLIRPLWVMVLCLFVCVLLAMMAGRETSGDVITAVATIPRSNRFLFHLVDLKTRLNVNVRIPINGVRRVALSPDGRQALIYTANPNLQSQSFQVFDVLSRRVSYRLDMPGQSPTDIFVLRQMNDYLPVWSPDSRRIAFRDPGSRGLYVIDLDRLVTQHVFEEALVYLNEFSWSPDSQQVAFLSGDGIWLSDLAVESTHSLAQGFTGSVYLSQWSPDSTRLAYYHLIDSEPTLASYILDTHSGGVLPVTLDDAHMPRWSPDGAWIVYFSGRIGRREVYTLRLSDGTLHPLGGTDIHSVEWSPDSTRLALAETSGSVYVVDPTGGNRQHITDDGTFPHWSPDGAYLVYEKFTQVGRRYQNELYLSDLNGGAPQMIGSGDRVRWSPGGDTVSFLYQTVDDSRLQVIAVNSRKTIYLSDLDQYVGDYAYWQW